MTLIRGTGVWTPAVHAFLRHLTVAAPGIAPKVLGLAEGEEILSCIPGRVPAITEFSTVSVAAVRSTGRLLRRLHEASRSFRLPPGVEWHRTRAAAGSRVVICHNDVSPRNTVFHGDEAVAFIDWDFAGLTILGGIWRMRSGSSRRSCRTQAAACGAGPRICPTVGHE